MWLDQDQEKKDLAQIVESDFVPWEKLRGKTVLVTGATGLIGHLTVAGLLYASKERQLGTKVIALVRDTDKAKERFAEWMDDGNLSFAVGSVEELPPINGNVDYVIHGASQTASKAFVSQAVETIRTSVLGTSNMLELAKEKNCEGFLYLSSMEVYGHPPKGHKVKESDAGAFSPLDLRNSYPIGKQICESLCCAYAQEYHLPAKIIRLTQTFGAGVNYNDSRVFAEFGRCVMEGRDIVMRTKGETERSYLYVSDAVTACLMVLFLGEPGQAYNAADESTYCSIAEMAEQVASMGGVKVCYEIHDEKTFGYPATLYMDLDTTSLQSLGWKPEGGGISLLVMYEKMMAGWGRIYNGHT